MRFTDMTTGMAGVDLTDPIAIERHWRDQFAAILRSEHVRETLGSFLIKLVPKAARVLVPRKKIRELVGRGLDVLARWVESGDGLRDLVAEEGAGC